MKAAVVSGRPPVREDAKKHRVNGFIASGRLLWG
jgi:hypothetical protein